MITFRLESSLQKISDLDDGWNGKDSTKFDPLFIDFCRNLITSLSYTSDAQPEKDGSIKFDFASADDMIILNIYPNHNIDIYIEGQGNIIINPDNDPNYIQKIDRIIRCHNINI